MNTDRLWYKQLRSYFRIHTGRHLVLNLVIILIELGFVHVAPDSIDNKEKKGDYQYSQYYVHCCFPYVIAFLPYNI